MFNDEEMIYMNRIAMVLFSNYGVELKFQQFLDQLQLLQEGEFHEQVEMMLEMVVNGRGEREVMIEVDSLIGFVMCSMPQQTAIDLNVEDMLRLQFK